jgi:hypothetical protein
MATTTPNYGWPVPTSTDYVKDGATAIEALGDAIDATVFGLGVGLKLVKSQVIGSAVSSVTVTSAFSTTYESYKIVVFGGSGSSSGADYYLKFNNSAGSTYCTGGIRADINGAATANFIINNSSSGIAIGTTGLTTYLTNFDVINPFAASATHVSMSSSSNSGATSKFTVFGGGFDTNAASQTGFILAPSTGTLTGGTIAVYGYAK